MTPTVVEAVSALRLAGARVQANVAHAVTGMTLSQSHEAVTELALSIEDPGFDLLASGLLRLGTEARYEGLRLAVAAVETGSGAGQGALDVRLRSWLVERIKRRTGPLVMANVSPSTFVAREVQAAGGRAVVQPSASRPQVMRDTDDETNERPSSWSTFDRLATELGYELYEAAGTVYFGRVSWLLDRAADVAVQWGGGNADLRPLSVPTCRRSLDDPDRVTVALSLPRPWIGRVRPGDALRLAGVPTFAGRYLVTSVELSPSDGTDDVQVQAETPVDREPRPPEPEDGDSYQAPAGASSGDGPATTRATSSDGWRTPMVGRISSRYGPRGGRMHHGLDIAGPTGTRIVAARGGRVTHAGWGTGYGNVVYVDHGGGWTSRYAHLSRFAVKRGDTVAAGQVLGYCGATGNATGPHLHFEIRQGGQSRDPERFLP